MKYVRTGVHRTNLVFPSTSRQQGNIITSGEHSAMIGYFLCCTEADS